MTSTMPAVDAILKPRVIYARADFLAQKVNMYVHQEFQDKRPKIVSFTQTLHHTPMLRYLLVTMEKLAILLELVDSKC